MGSEADYDHQIYSPSKLSMLISRPIKPPEAAPLPPPTTAVSIPFQWEEAPGKPRPCHTQPEPDRCGRRALELPPRLVFPEAKVSSNVLSPTTVLDGPYVGRAVSFTTSYRSPRMVGKDQWNGNFGSSRWSSSKKNRTLEFGGSMDFSNGFTFWDDHGFEANSTTAKAKIAKVGRRGSLFSLSHSRSHLWASIYESLKQVVPWKRKQEKQHRKWDFRRN